MKKIFTLLFIALAGYHLVSAQCNPPIINSFSPITGFIGSTVTINGANFDANAANNQVFFGATQAQIISSSFGTMTVVVPVGATTSLISVKNNCNKTAYSKIPFNGIFCPTPLTNSTYQNTQFTLGSYGAYNMLSQDIDGDGKPDIVCQGFSSGITIARNTSTIGNMSFTRHDFSVSARSVAVADFDGDGKRDVLLAGDAGVYIMRNTSTVGSVSFTTTRIGSLASFYQSNIGDFDNDGLIDFCAGRGGDIITFRNTSTGVGSIAFVQNTVASTGQGSTGIQCADVDGDGLTDILASQGNANRIIALRNTNTGNSTTFSFGALQQWNTAGQYPYRCAIADFDKDGKIDITTCNYNGATNTAVFRNTSSPGTIAFASPINPVAPGGNYRIQVGDVDGDGLADIVTKSLSVNVFSVYKNTSTGPGNVSFAARIDYSSSATAEVSGIVIGDLDGDYVPDIATSGTSSNAIRFHRNTSSQSDVIKPTAICKNITVALGPNGTVAVTSNMINNGSSDACGIGSLTIDGDSTITLTCADTGTVTLKLVVKDNSGNSDSCYAQVTVAPAAIIVAGQTTVCQGQTVTLTANQGDSYQWYESGNAISGATSQTYVATVTGDYQVAVTNAGGCSGISSITHVTVNLNPTVTVSPSPIAPLCNGQAVLTASLSSIYKWKKDGNYINGATQQSYTATATGSYNVEVIDIFGCSAVSSTITVTSTAPEIDVLGNGTSIANGDNTPSAADHTDYGTVGSETRIYTIDNSGTGPLNIDNISITGANAGDFTLGGISLPASIAAGNSTTFTVTFSRNTLGSSAATVNISNIDCDESGYSFDIFGELNCTNPVFTLCPDDIIANTDQGICAGTVSYSVSVSAIPTPAVNYSFSGATSGSGSGLGSGSTFNLGTTTVTITASNVCNSAICEFDITVVDNEAPLAVAQDVSVTLSGGAASVSAAQIDNGSWDACGIQSVSVSPNSFDCSNIGANTVTLTVTDNNNNVSTTTATVTVVGTIPTVSIAQGVQPTFCQGGAVVMTASSNEDVSYAWSNSSNTAVSNAYASGNYSVTVTNQYGCQATATTTVSYSQTDILSSYTILAEDEIKLHQETVVNSGGVGSIGTSPKKSEIEVKDDSYITASGTFAKATKVEIKNNSSITNVYSGSPAGVAFPAFMENPYCDDKKCGHKHCDHNGCKKNGCKHDNCNHGKYDVKVKKNATVTLNDSIFRKIHIEEGATVIFTNANIYADEIETQKNVTLVFATCANIYLCKELKIHENNTFNEGALSVVVYAEKKVDIKKGTDLTASIYTKGHLDTKGDKKARNTLTGMFIGEQVHAHHTTFNSSNNCGKCSSSNKRMYTEDKTGLRTEDYINVYPNPTSSSTTVALNVNSEGKLKVSLMNLSGQLIRTLENNDFSGMAEVNVDMSDCAEGMYFIKVEYGNNTQVFKVQRVQ